MKEERQKLNKPDSRLVFLGLVIWCMIGFLLGVATTYLFLFF